MIEAQPVAGVSLLIRSSHVLAVHVAQPPLGWGIRKNPTGGWVGITHEFTRENLEGSQHV